MRIETASTREAVAALAPEWDSLALTESRDGFFRTSGWYRAWMDHIRPSAQAYVLVARDGGNRIAALAPLCRVRYDDLGFRLKAVAWAGREVVSGDYLGLLARQESPEAVPVILEALWNARSDWSILVLGELTRNGALHRALSNFAEHRRLPLREQEERFCPYIALPPTFDGYLAELSSSTRYHIRRRMRDAEKAGGVLRVHTNAEIEPHIDTLVRLHTARWHKDGQPGTLTRPGFVPFLKQICTQPPAGATCRLFILEHQGAASAALLAFQFGSTALYYQAGWDPESALAPHSPGVALMAHSIRHAIESGLQYYDFLRGDEAYKSKWTKTYRETATLLVGRSFAAREYLRVARLKDIAKQHLRKGGFAATSASTTAAAETAPAATDMRTL